MPKMKRVIEVEGEYVVMVQGDPLPIANRCANEWEASVVALLCTLGPYPDKVVTIAFNPVDSESADDMAEADGRIWYNGEEYQAGEDMRDAGDYLLWLSRYGYGQEFKDAGKRPPKNIWDQDDASVNNEVKKWLIRVASEHEVHQFLPVDCTTSESSPDSGDLYHLNLLRDLVRDPGGHRLDDSEKRGLLDTLDRVMEMLPPQV
jgi:hypothetical protein